MASRGVLTAEKGEQETQILFLKKIKAEPPPNSLQVRRGIHRCPFLKPREWAGCTLTRGTPPVSKRVRRCAYLRYAEMTPPARASHRTRACLLARSRLCVC